MPHTHPDAETQRPDTGTPHSGAPSRMRSAGRALGHSSNAQPNTGEAIGSILNGTRKPRWKAWRAAMVMLLFALAAFTGSIAVGSGSRAAGVAAAAMLLAGVVLVIVELRRRRNPTM